jgi:general secretion pathway protein D
VPVLGDIPGLGVLFRSNTKSRGRTNLMIFIRPTIIRTAADAQRLAADRWGYIRGEQQRVRPEDEPSLDVMLREYMRTQPPAYPEPTVIAPVAPVSSQPLPATETPGG